jgi:hypothetical protein
LPFYFGTPILEQPCRNKRIGGKLKSVWILERFRSEVQPCELRPVSPMILPL